MKKTFLLIAWVFLAILAIAVTVGPFLVDAYSQNMETILVGPSFSHWMGTDSLGRDLFARVLVGGRVSLFIGLVSAVLTFFWGFFYGACAGWFEGRIDRLMMRFCDILMAIPSFILVSVLILLFQALWSSLDPFVSTLVGLCLGISATHWMALARLTRGLVIEIKRRPFIEAATALGGSRSHIIRQHILPHILNPLLILVALQIPTSVLYESFMSFIGLGIHPPEASWGILVREGWKTLSSFPHLLLFPSLVLFLTVWSFHTLLDRHRFQGNR